MQLQAENGVALTDQIAGGVWDRLRAMFPEREFIMRSQGHVRFVKFTTRLQMTVAGAVCLLALIWLASMAVMGFTQYESSAERASLLNREALVAKSEDRFEAYSDDLASTTEDLQRRQDYLEAMTQLLPDDVAQAANDTASDTANDTVTDSSEESGELIGMIRAVFPAAAGLAQIEARQLAFVERLTRFADRRSNRAEKAIRTLGLDPRVVVAANDEGLGGPLELLASEADGSLDPRFERLGASLARMSALERGLNGIPQVMPADEGSMSSGFGYRRDPFTGSGAMHNGLDFRAPHGSAIHAAADGTVSYVGYKSGYGKTVEVDHGSGMVTRYAHMSRFDAKPGAKVTAGEIIGRIGSTGRSTGPHLHFEVRINDRAVNPRPFLETAPHVLEEARTQLTPGHSRGQ